MKKLTACSVCRVRVDEADVGCDSYNEVDLLVSRVPYAGACRVELRIYSKGAGTAADD